MTRAVDRVDLLSEDEFCRRYVISSLIGAGGLGSVYRACQVALDRAVAIKKIHAWLTKDPGLWMRFMEEARLLARLSNRRIVRIYDSGLVEGCPFIVMELVDGVGLDQIFTRVSTPEALRRLLEIIHGVLEGLEYDHGEGVLHRDLKPANILVGQDETIKIVDFGLAKGLDSPAVTRTGLVPGTLPYLAPELLSGSLASVQSDLYVLGVIAFRMIVGRHVHGLDAGEVEFQSLRASMDPVPLASAAPGTPPEVSSLVDDLLRRHPDRRPRSAAEVRLRLAHLLEAAQGPRRGTARASRTPPARPVFRAAQTPPSAPRRGTVWPWLVGGSCLLGLVLSLGRRVERPAVGPAPASHAPSSVAPGAIDPRSMISDLRVDRPPTTLTVRFSTPPGVVGEASWRSAGAPPSAPWRTSRRTGPGGEHATVVGSLDPFLDYDLVVRAIQPTTGAAHEVRRVAPSPDLVLTRTCQQLMQEGRLDDVVRRVLGARSQAARKGILQGLLARVGFQRALDLVLPHRREVMGAREGGPSRRHHTMRLNQLSKLRRLDQLARLVGLPFSTRVDELLGPEHAEGPPAPWPRARKHRAGLGRKRR